MTKTSKKKDNYWALSAPPKKKCNKYNMSIIFTFLNPYANLMLI